MTKKPVTRKQEPATARAGEGGIAVTGGIHAGRDVIMGDQYNDFRQQVAQISTASEFVAQLEELQAEIAALKAEPALTAAQIETVAVVEGNVQNALEEAQKPEPMVARITGTLTAAKAVMDSLAGSIQSAVGLGLVIGELGLIAVKLFGG